MYQHDFVFGPIWYVASAKSKAEKQRTKLVNLCMEGKGYTVGEEP